MNDDRLDRALRDADPYRPGLADRLHGAEHELLEEIMSVPATSRTARRFLIPLATAAAVAGLLAATVVLRDPPDHRNAALPAISPSVLSPSAGADAWTLALKAAEDNPRLLIDEPGWRVTSVYGFAEKSGDIFFAKDARTLNITWYPEDQYASYYADRLHVSKPELGRIGDWQGNVFTYSDTDYALMLRPRDGMFAELRTSGPWPRATFDAILTRIKRVDARTWLAALPPEIVTPDRIGSAAAEILADVPLPPGFDVASLNDLGTNDKYQFGAQVIGRVGCGWIAEWERADRIGDDVARLRAADAMRDSHQWKILKWMEDEGEWSESFWSIADGVVTGQHIPQYREALGCA